MIECLIDLIPKFKVGNQNIMSFRINQGRSLAQGLQSFTGNWDNPISLAYNLSGLSRVQNGDVELPIESIC